MMLEEEGRPLSEKEEAISTGLQQVIAEVAMSAPPTCTPYQEEAQGFFQDGRSLLSVASDRVVDAL
jgi:hypothetical protein